MKKFYILIISLIVILIPLTAYADTYNAYASVTENTSQINILLQYLFNQKDFNVFEDYVALRTGDYDFSLFYNIKDGNARRLRYYATSSGYNTVWHASISDVSNFSYNKNNYTIVGNTDDSLGSSEYQEFVHQTIIKYTVPFIVVLFIFFIWRIKKRGAELKI